MLLRPITQLIFEILRSHFPVSFDNKPRADGQNSWGSVYSENLCILQCTDLTLPEIHTLSVV